MNDRRDETLVKSEVEEWFIPPPYRLNRHIGNASRPLAVFFERAACSQCDILHHQVMRESLTHQLVQLFDNVLLDAAAQTPVITPSGETTTAARWAKELDINYFPTVVLFDPNGTEIVRAAAAFRTFHMQSLFDYVLTGAYRTQPSLQRYLSTRGEQLREAGYDVDIWSYDLPISFDGQPVSLEKIQAVTGGVAAAGD
jgi:thioredoxin-related protein